MLFRSHFCFVPGLYEEAVTVYDTSLRAGNEGRRLRLRLARSQLALHRIHLRHAHRRHPPPTLLPPPSPTTDLAKSSELAASTPAAATVASDGGDGNNATASEGVDRDAGSEGSSQQHHVSLLALQAPSPVPLVAAAEVSRRHLEHARRHMAEVLTYSAVIRHHPLTLFEAATVIQYCTVLLRVPSITYH